MCGKLGTFVVAIALVGCVSVGQTKKTPQAADPEIEKLIDRLVDLGDETTGAHSTAWGGQFMAIDEEPEFHGGIIGSKPPSVDANMRKLVQLGVKALPSLMKHLDDKRETKLVTKHEQWIGAMWYSDEYDSRYADKARQPVKVNTDNGLSSHFDKTISTFTLHVGDACYIAIGQIVNRGLSVIRYQPTACVVVNSPIERPSLADAVKKDWQGLTEKGHADQLENDAYSLWPYASGSAVKRLLYYYPDRGETVVKRLLSRKVYDYMAIWDIGDDKLMKTSDPKEWRRIYAETEAQYGKDAAAMMPHWLHWSNWETSTDHPKAEQDRAKQVFKVLFPNYRPEVNVFHPVVEARDQGDLIRSLITYKSKTLDEAIQETFRQAILTKGHPDLTKERERRRIDGLDIIADACFERMQGKGFDNEYLAFFEPRIAEIEKFSVEAWEKQDLDDLKKRVAKLKAGK